MPPTYIVQGSADCQVLNCMLWGCDYDHCDPGHCQGGGFPPLCPVTCMMSEADHSSRDSRRCWCFLRSLACLPASLSPSLSLWGGLANASWQETELLGYDPDWKWRLHHIQPQILGRLWETYDVPCFPVFETPKECSSWCHIESVLGGRI